MTTLEIVRLSISLFFVVFMVFAAIVMWRNSSNMNKLLRQGQVDKEARERAVHDLLVTAAALAEKTRAKLDETSDKHADELGEKIDRNTELTIEAARASANAAEVANSVNDKIADTNRRLAEELDKH